MLSVWFDLLEELMLHFLTLVWFRSYFMPGFTDMKRGFTSVFLTMINDVSNQLPQFGCIK